MTEKAYDVVLNGISDAFISKLNASGTQLLYSTFLGGSRDEEGAGIVWDNKKNIYVTGWTNSSDFPTTPGAYDGIYNGSMDIFVVKMEFGCNLPIDIKGCNLIENVKFKASEDYKEVTLSMENSLCAGRLLSVLVKLDKVCLKQQRIIGILLQEIIENEAVSKGFRVVTVEGSELEMNCECNTLNIGPVEFVIPEEKTLCRERQFQVRVIAH